MQKILLLAIAVMAAACSSTASGSETPLDTSIPTTTSTTTFGPSPLETVALWLEHVRFGDSEKAATLFEASPEAAALGYESPQTVSEFYIGLGWLDAMQACTEERMGVGVVALDCSFAASSELHDLLDVEAEVLRFIFEDGTPTELSVARSGTLVHHELQLYAREYGGEAYQDSCTRPGQSGRFWYDGACAEFLATIVPGVSEALRVDS